eukprot:6183821-Pleurochrysis_carterae.AAC.2
MCLQPALRRSTLACMRCYLRCCKLDAATRACMNKFSQTRAILHVVARIRSEAGLNALARCRQPDAINCKYSIKGRREDL